MSLDTVMWLFVNHDLCNANDEIQLYHMTRPDQQKLTELLPINDDHVKNVRNINYVRNVSNVNNVNYVSNVNNINYVSNVCNIKNISI